MTFIFPSPPFYTNHVKLPDDSVPFEFKSEPPISASLIWLMARWTSSSHDFHTGQVCFFCDYPVFVLTSSMIVRLHFFCSLYTLLHSHHTLMSVRSASTATTNQGSGTKNKPPSTTELCINLVREFIPEMKLCRKWSKHSRNFACMIRSPLTKSNQPSPASS